MTEQKDSACAARFVASPNHGARAAEAAIDCLILHYTGMTTAAAALTQLCSEAAQVSSHYFIDEDGTVLQLVPEARRAWHAGKSSWKGQTDLNSSSIGIEIVNGGHDGGLPDFPAIQIEAVINLCRDICARHNIPAERVLAHSDIAPGRKIDPGEKFPWSTLHAHGVGHWVKPAPLGKGAALNIGASGPDVAALRSQLAQYGYAIAPGDIYDEATQTIVSAFQLHFRPARIDGLADLSTRETLHALIEALPYSAATIYPAGS
jgi:N-acetylmuramoyl-L-alanine amidase